MTVHSMTGFGSGRAEVVLEDGTQLSISAEAKTVNHKHLQAKFRLPHEFASLEPALDKLVRSKLKRGATQVSIDVARIGGSSSFEVDAHAAARYMEFQRSLVVSLGADGGGFKLREMDSVAEVLQLPGVVVNTKSTGGVAADGPESQVLLQAVTGALDALVEMRLVEGDAMLRDLRGSAGAVRGLVDDIGKHMPEVQARHRARLVERVRELSENAEVSEADLAREIALLADKLDVSEELTRLDSHLEQLATLLDRGGEVGRKLDFLAQEFFREANTIGSKCSDAGVAHLVVDLKTHVERLREQVQNVE